MKYVLMTLLFMSACNGDVIKNTPSKVSCDYEETLINATLNVKKIKSFFSEEIEEDYRIVFTNINYLDKDSLVSQGVVFRVVVDSMQNNAFDIDEDDYGIEKIYISKIEYDESNASVNIYSLYYGKNFDLRFEVKLCVVELKEIRESDI